VRRDEPVDEQLCEPVTGDIDPCGAKDLDLAFVTTRYTKVERSAAEVENKGETGRNVGRERCSDGFFHEPDVAEPG